jgi:hypothetical protein
VYPGNWWFGHIDSEEAVDAVIDSIEKRSPQAEYVIT